ncbi:AMP-binding protein [Nonomuraea sp. NBC_01738]|uniref:AMP-binding protein n=1 Tax=Nonomuraea sp. NBC_01738 TaxID=2976003 RepID=UPI002E10CE35|nr:AMP-binding protein [Nonomuraea sp. NBC_01738]
MAVNTLAALLAARAGDDRPALTFEGRTWSWHDYLGECDRAATWMSAFEHPAHVAVLADNVPGVTFLVGAAARSGNVLVALNPTRTPAELTRDARATDVRVLLHDEPYGEAAREIADALGIPHLPLTEATSTTEPQNTRAQRTADPGDLVMLIFTSGTSGTPRAVRVTQRKLAVPGTSLAAMLTHDDVVYCSMPLFHSGALMAAYAPAVAAGATLVLRRRFSASGLLPDLRRHGVTYLHYVGKALSYVLATEERPDDADNPLKLAFGNEGGATTARRFGERFGCYVIESFGSTETAISITPDPSGPPGCLGRLPDGIEIRDPVTGLRRAPAEFDAGRLANADAAVGELVNVGGLGLFDGYYNDPEADAERIRRGVYWSGDLAYADKDGYVFFAGRGTERLRVDGENLAVAPIEAALRELPGVIEAAVYPVPDAAAGDQVMAALVTGPLFTLDSLAEAELGAKAVPRYVRLSAELPQTASHKVVKRLLVREGWHAATDPVYLRTPTGYRPLTSDDIRDIEHAFTRHGRQHLLES